MANFSKEIFISRKLKFTQRISTGFLFYNEHQTYFAEIILSSSCTSYIRIPGYVGYVDNKILSSGSNDIGGAYLAEIMSFLPTSRYLASINRARDLSVDYNNNTKKVSPNKHFYCIKSKHRVIQNWNYVNICDFSNYQLDNITNVQFQKFSL
ncbi:unnamed protein product [Rhizophagus irregularis]|nr:unnamed protein product [Rhizophagus irregularis]CAB5216501.1 unnamed protein product [Rhizophagus irregularis]CAB5364077.1 unnamed protein product [Rhizophagus irregularis]